MKNENNITPINEDLDVVEFEVEEIKKKIYTIRGKQVMLDNDVAKLYHYATKNINKALKRNMERFPEDFCFQLTEKELENLRFQFGTSSLEKDNYGGRRYLPYAFTEQGVAMLSGLLKNETAVQVSINIMRAFVEMRKFINENRQLFERLTNVEYKLLKHDKKFDEVFKQLGHEENINQKIFFEGQIYDAYSLIVDIIYIDDSVLKMLTKKNKDVEVVILTSGKSNIQNLDVEKFNKEYPTLKISKTNKFHDRFIIIDNKELYHCGASIKDLGKKCFAINKMEDISIIGKLVTTI